MPFNTRRSMLRRFEAEPDEDPRLRPPSANILYEVQDAIDLAPTAGAAAALWWSAAFARHSDEELPAAFGIHLAQAINAELRSSYFLARPIVSRGFSIWRSSLSPVLHDSLIEAGATRHFNGYHLNGRQLRLPIACMDVRQYSLLAAYGSADMPRPIIWMAPRIALHS